MTPVQLATFCRAMISQRREIMATTGRGYRRYSLRRTGIGTDRRRDKLEGLTRVKTIRRIRGYGC